MERRLLKEYLEQGLSLAQIGALEDRDPSTVGYWIQKHGLTANGRAKYAPRGGLRREQLEPLVNEGATLQEIATEVNRSIPTVRYWLKRWPPYEASWPAGGVHRRPRRWRDPFPKRVCEAWRDRVPRDA